MSENNGYYIVNATVQNEKGIHARPTMRLIDAAKGYNGGVRILSYANGVECNAKDPMSLMLLEATKGCELEVRVERGEGCEEMALKLVGIIGNSR